MPCTPCIFRWNSVFVGWSRDGFHFSRPPPGTPGVGTAERGGKVDPARRTPFMPMDPLQRVGSWNFGCVLATGGPAIVGPAANESMLFYAGGSTGDVGGGAGNHNWTQAMGAATLRRDGFASIDAPAAGGVLTTTPLKFARADGGLWLNVVGAVRAEVLDVAGAPIAPFSLANCSGTAAATDATKTAITWPASLSELAGVPVRFSFHMAAGARLFAFWTADADGRSGGFVGRGGPAFAGPRDV